MRLLLCLSLFLIACSSSTEAFLDKAAAEPGAIRTDSGMIYRELRAGSGPSPKATDTVKVNYRGTLTDGTEFDSSYKTNEPAQFPLNRVIPCWTEGVQKMKGESRSWCAPQASPTAKAEVPQRFPAARR